jgi:hypothetical protein
LTVRYFLIPERIGEIYLSGPTFSPFHRHNSLKSVTENRNMSQEQGYTVEVKKVVSVEMPFPYQQYNVNFVVQGADSSNDSDKNPVPWFSVFKIGDEDARAAIDVYTPGGGDLPVPYNDNGMLKRVQQHLCEKYAPGDDKASSLGSTAPPPSASSAGASTATDATQ